MAMAKVLLKNGADLNAADEKEQTPLLKALTTGKTDLALWLLDQGAELSSEGQSLPVQGVVGLCVGSSSGCE